MKKKSNQAETCKKIATVCVFIVFILLSTVLSALGDNPQQPFGQTGQLKVIVTGLESNTGQVRVALFDSEDNYVNGKKSFRRCSAGIENRRAECIFEDLPYKMYAIRLYHDVNGNGKLDKDSGGLPTEPYAFSNNAKGTMGPAKWSDAKFQVQLKNMKMEITLE
jgi:uncharacterized protein (DUF2141 family)